MRLFQVRNVLGVADEVGGEPFGEAGVDYDGVDGGSEEDVENVDCSVMDDGCVADF